MKNNFKFIFMFLFAISLGFVFNIGDVNATDTIYSALSCPSTAVTNETVTCSILAKTTKDTSIKDVKFDSNDLSNVTVVKKEFDNYINKLDGQVTIGTVTLKIGSSDSDAIVAVKVISDSAGFQSSKSMIKISVISSVNTLKSLKVDGAVVNGFSKNITSYNIETKNKTINISASATNSSAKVTGTGLKTLNCGLNSYKVIVKADSGSKRTYSLNVNRKCDSKVYLSGISVSSGKLSPAFDKSVTNYTVNVDSTVKTITITGNKGNNNQTITGNVKDYELKDGSNKIKITVSGNNSEKTIYTVNVVKGKQGSSDTYLSSLSISSGSITFNKNVFEYETRVLYNVRNIEVLATPEKSTSKCTVTGGDGLVVGENIIKITVTAESGATKDYIIKVARLKEGESFGDNANIKSIVVKGYENNFKFEYNKLSYSLVIKNEKSLDIVVVMDDSNSTYRIIGNSDLKDGSLIKIETTSADGTSKIYTIEIIKKSSAIYVILFILLMLIAGGIVAYAYFRYVRKKKELLDVNGFRINNSNVKKEIPQNSLTKHSAKKNNLNLNKPVVKVNINNVENKPKETPIANNNGTTMSGNKCPKCGRELLGNPEVCPYCNVKLK